MASPCRVRLSGWRRLPPRSRRRPGISSSLWPAGGGFAELALASADRLAPMSDRVSFREAAGLVICGGTAYEGLVDRGRLQAGETVLITATAGGAGSAAVQIAAAVGRPAPWAWPARPTTTSCGAWAPARSSTTNPPTGSSRCAPPFPAASTCCWTAPAARPATKPSVRSATAAGRSSWSWPALPPSWSTASRANRSPPTSTGSGWRHRAAWSKPANCAPGRRGVAVGSGSRGAGAGRGPAHARQDRAADRAVAATPLGPAQQGETEEAGTSRDEHQALTLGPHREVSCLPAIVKPWRPHARPPSQPAAARRYSRPAALPQRRAEPADLRVLTSAADSALRRSESAGRMWATSPEMPAASPLCVPAATGHSCPRRRVRVAWRGTLSQAWAGGRSAEGIRSAGPIGEQITWAMTLAGDVGFRWWL